MPAIPPSPPPPSISTPQTGDPGGDAIISYIQSLIGNSDPAVSHFGSIAYNYIEQQIAAGQPGTGDNVVKWIQYSVDWIRDLLNPGTPSNQRPDIYMCFAQQGWITDQFHRFLDGISGQIQTIEMQYGIQYPFNVPLPSAMDYTYIAIENWVNQSNPSPPSASLKLILTSILNQMYDDPNLGSWDGDLGYLWLCISNIESDPNFFTTYNNPPITASDLQTLSNMLEDPYQLPDFFQEYLTLGYSAGSLSGPLQQLTESLVGEMRNEWGNFDRWGDWVIGSTAQLQTWLANTIGNPQFLSTYPGITAADIETVAQDVGLTLPSSFATFFNAMVALLPSDPTSADYKMIMDFQSKWIPALFANPTTWNATTWFETTFAAPGSMSPPYPAGMDDLYMLYPLADISTIQAMVDVFVPSTTTYTPTAWDTAYRTIFAAHGSDTSGVYFDFFKECRTVGSSDTGQAIEMWVDNFALGGFSQYPTMKPLDVMNFLANFNMVTTIGGSRVSYVCDFITNYIQTDWLPGKTGSDKQFGQQLINQLVGWVGTEAPPGKLSDLQAFITAQNYTAKYPSSAADITALLASFGLTP